MQLVSAGYDRVDIAAARRAKCRCATTAAPIRSRCAEHAIMLMLAVYRRLIWQHDERRRPAAGAATISPRELSRARRQDARHHRPRHHRQEGGAARAGLRHARAVLRHRCGSPRMRRTRSAPRFRSLPELLRTSDIVSLHVPLNAVDAQHDRRPGARADEALRRSWSTPAAVRWWTRRRCTRR